MDLNELVKLSKEENEFVDKKEGIGDATGRTIAAFATSGGGKVIIGISDNNKLLRFLRYRELNE